MNNKGVETMEFNIYDLSDLLDIDPENFVFDDSVKDDVSEVESGLSAGEIRQSLLDRFRQAILNQNYDFVNLNLKKYDVEIDETNDEDDLGEASLIEDVEKALYDLEDEDLMDTVWVLPDEVIYIEGVEW